MSDAFGPPVFVRPFNRYKVYKARATKKILIVGIDKIDHKYSILKVPCAEEPNWGPLDLQEGERRLPLA